MSGWIQAAMQQNNIFQFREKKTCEIAELKKAVIWLHKSSKPIVRGLRSSALEEFEFRCRTASFPKVKMSNTIHFRVEDLRQAKNN